MSPSSGKIPGNSGSDEVCQFLRASLIAIGDFEIVDGLAFEFEIGLEKR
jgi:hypothetical protein